jgi:alpha-2-macroglobulin
MEIDWSPKVVRVSPAPGEESGLSGAITIRFDQPMDRDSVEKAFAIERIGPGGGSGPSVSGSFSWPRDDTVVFTPAASLERQQRYRVEIDETAFGLSGKALTAAIRLEMETVGYLEVSQVIPADGTSNVQVDSAITVLFNRPVVPIVTTAQQGDWPDPLQIEPPINGRGEWTSSSIYRFVPDEPLDGDTAYSVTIAAGLEDVTGGLLEAGHSWSFRTAGPRVVSSEPANRDSQVGPTQPITLTFNMPMNRDATQAAVQLQPTTAVDYQWRDNDRVLALIPRQRLNMGQEYQLTVSTAARSANGGAALTQTYTAVFNTPPTPAVLSTSPADGQTADRYAYGFSIRFASVMDMTTVEGAIRIQPEPARRPGYYFSDYDNNLYVNFELNRSAEYIVTIPGTAADPYGNSLGADYTFRFNTPPYQPLVSLNLPQYISQLSRSHPSDVTVAHRNVSQLNAELHNVGLPVNRLLNQYSVNEMGRPGEPLRSWSIPVDTPLNQLGQTNLPLADGGVLPNGVYLLTVRAPENSRDDRWWQNQTNLIIVADTNLVVKEEFGAIHVWATDLATGQPVAGRRLTFFGRGGNQIGGEVVTDDNGFATLSGYMPPMESNWRNLKGVLVVSNQPGESGFGAAVSEWNPDVSPWYFGLPTAWNDETERFAYLFTDRPIYRPGDTVHLRGIVRDTNYGRFPLPTRQTITVIIEAYSFYEANQLIMTENVTLDDGGGFTLDFVVPESARLGSYRIAFRDGDLQNAERMFTVAQYRTPEFLVTMSSDTPEILPDQRPQAAVEAAYFFGGSASDLEVNWTLYREDYHLPWQGPYFSFRDWRDASRSWNPWLVGDGRDWLTSGTGQTDANGRFEIPLAAEMFADTGGRYTVEASVLDAANRSIASRVEIVVHPAETYVGVSPTNYISQAGSESQVNLITVDWDGQPVANQPVEVVFYQRDWVPRREGQFGQYYTEWETVDTEVSRDSVRTDGQGRATAAFTPTIGGSYLAVATVTDNGGRQQTSSSYIWVMSSQFAGWQIDPREKRLNLTPDRGEYRPGETAEILIQSPYSPGARAWVIIERGVMLEQRLISLDGSSHLLTIPITANHAPNIFVTVVAVQGADGGNQYAEMRLGMTELIVSPEQMLLNVEMTPDRGFYQPGGEVTYDILVTNQQGQPVQADVSLALVDLAVLTLLPDNAPPIGDAFYARQPYRSQIGSGLFFSGEGLELELPQEVGGMGGGGGDGGAEAAVFLEGEEADETRRDFRDTAHWEGRLTTNADGRASLTLALPDNLTTWRLSAKAVTNQTLVGQDYVDIVASLPLLIRPVTPRFFTVGDAMLLGALVHNNTDQAIEAAVSLQALGLSLNGPAEQTVTIAAGGHVLVQWPITAEDYPFADLLFRVSGGGYQDATTPTFGVGDNNQIPILRYAGQDWVASSGLLDEAGRRIEGVLLPPEFDNRRGSVTVTLNASLAAAVLDALEVLNRPRYGGVRCTQSILDQMLPNVATGRALAQLDLDNPDMAARLTRIINRDLGELQRSQRGSGGWGWCDTTADDPVVSAYALLTLAKAQEAGYEVSGSMISGAQRYIRAQLADMEQLTQRYDANRAAFFAYALVESGGLETAALDELFSDYRNLLDPYAKGLLLLAYHNAAPESPNVAALLSDLNNSAVVSATGAHWEDETRDWRNWNSDTRGTAMIIAALSAVQPDHPFAAPAVSWLMTARTAQLWPSSHDTAWSLLALTDWMAATGELNANYDYNIALNARDWQEGQFTQENLTETDAYTIGLDRLLADEVNFFDIQRGAGDGRLYYNLHLTSHAAAHLEAMNRGFIVQRAYYDANCRADDGRTTNDEQATPCEPITTIQAGQQIRVELTVILPHNRYYVTVEDYFPAGAEALDPSLETTPGNLGDSMQITERTYHYGFWGWWLFNRIEYRDDRVVFSSNYLPAGTYQYSYILQAIMPGDYQVAPTTARQEFMPEVFGRADGMLFVIEE